MIEIAIVIETSVRPDFSWRRDHRLAVDDLEHAVTVAGLAGPLHFPGLPSEGDLSTSAEADRAGEELGGHRRSRTDRIGLIRGPAQFLQEQRVVTAAAPADKAAAATAVAGHP